MDLQVISHTLKRQKADQNVVSPTIPHEPMDWRDSALQSAAMGQNPTATSSATAQHGPLTPVQVVSTLEQERWMGTPHDGGVLQRKR